MKTVLTLIASIVLLASTCEAQTQAQQLKADCDDAIQDHYLDEYLIYMTDAPQEQKDTWEDRLNYDLNQLGTAKQYCDQSDSYYYAAASNPSMAWYFIPMAEEYYDDALAIYNAMDPDLDALRAEIVNY